ncbi:MAG: hypothetical protein IPK60_09230 [Sandaracinaceae bacterium]|jgi:hypothetical protein|nr:hypothetical protein [Sandaracinaceae bacterium]
MTNFAKLTGFSAAVLSLCATGCGLFGQSSAPATTAPALSHPEVALMPSPYEEPASTNPNSNENRAATVALPSSPWSNERIAMNQAPQPLVQAWRHADNRSWCAPIAPSSDTALMGAHARRSSFEGGWAVEFDKQGLAGIGRDGNTCATCGRGAFGIAGTSMNRDSIDEESVAAAWNDGSRAEYQSTDEDPTKAGAVATIVVPGQDCVYQVWSFVGQEHLNELVASLRFVDSN